MLNKKFSFKGKMKFSLLDTVVLNEDLLMEGLSAGMVGAVVDVYCDPCEAYEIEFCDNLGKTIAMLALLPSQLNKQI